MRDGDWLVGWGCATSAYPTNMGAATARVRLVPGGKVLVQTAAHEIGTGITTAIALMVVEGLGVPLDAVTVEIGDSTLPPAPVAGGSNSTASICNVVAKACEDIRGALPAPPSPRTARSQAPTRLRCAWRPTHFKGRVGPASR